MFLIIIPEPHAASILPKHEPRTRYSASLGILHENVTSFPTEPSDGAPHALAATQIAPLTSMYLPNGMLIVVPAFTINDAPGATVTLSVNVCVPVQVS